MIMVVVVMMLGMMRLVPVRLCSTSFAFFGSGQSPQPKICSPTEHVFGDFGDAESRRHVTSPIEHYDPYGKFTVTNQRLMRSKAQQRKQAYLAVEPA